LAVKFHDTRESSSPDKVVKRVLQSPLELLFHERLAFNVDRRLVAGPGDNVLWTRGVAVEEAFGHLAWILNHPRIWIVGSLI
jgi:hypothetical protein